MKLGVFCVFAAITILVVAAFTSTLAGDAGIIVGGFAIGVGFFGLGRLSRGRTGTANLR